MNTENKRKRKNFSWIETPNYYELRLFNKTIKFIRYKNIYKLHYRESKQCYDDLEILKEILEVASIDDVKKYNEKIKGCLKGCYD